jgi:hypothetical protein
MSKIHGQLPQHTSLLTLLFAITICLLVPTLIPKLVGAGGIQAVEAAPRVAMTPVTVPNRMLLSAKMECANIGRALLTALQIDSSSSPTNGQADGTSNDDVSVIINSPSSLEAEKVIQSHTGKYGSICFVVRRPG